MIHLANTLLHVSTEHAERLLDLRDHCDGSTQIAPAARTDRYPTHGFVITRNEADSLDLPVFDMDEYDQAEPATAWHRGLLQRFRDHFNDIGSAGCELVSYEAVSMTENFNTTNINGYAYLAIFKRPGEVI